MDIKREKAVSFSGHRSYKMAGGSLFATGGSGDLLKRLRAEVSKLADAGYTDFVCGMAEGFDLAAAETVISLREEFPGIRLHAYVPFAGQEKTFGAAARRQYDRVLEAADSVKYVCRGFTQDCYHRRNDAMVADSSVLICCYNGSVGGTRYTVRRALSEGLRVINIADGF